MPSNQTAEIESWLLCASAIIRPDANRLDQIARLAKQVKDWDSLIRVAESHGLAPILMHHLRQSGTDVPDIVLKQLRALSIRHRHATPTRLKEYAKIYQVLADEGVENAALKGIGLAGLIYPDPSLRPMRDIDFLVAPKDAVRAVQVLKDLGYEFEEAQPSRFMRRHHHLPNAYKNVDGLTVSVEIHIRALSGDSPDLIAFGHLEDPLQMVKTPFGEIATLGHTDMLAQVSRHALEPGYSIKLVAMMDIVGYTDKFVDEIDWRKLERKYPFFPVFLGLLHHVAPLPESLARFKPEGPAPADCGRLIPTFNDAIKHGDGYIKGIHTLLNPPEWWLNSYYGVAPGKTSRQLALLNHRTRVLRWVARRLIAASLPA